jgi:nicotinamidase-related amidase
VRSVEVDRAGTDANARTALRANAFAAEAARLGVRVIYPQQILDMDAFTWRQRRWEAGSRLCVLGSDGTELFMPPVPGARGA